MPVRLWLPQPDPDSGDWRCRFEIEGSVTAILGVGRGSQTLLARGEVGRVIEVPPGVDPLDLPGLSMFPADSFPQAAALLDREVTEPDPPVRKWPSAAVGAPQLQGTRWDGLARRAAGPRGATPRLNQRHGQVPSALDVPVAHVVDVTRGGRK